MFSPRPRCRSASHHSLKRFAGINHYHLSMSSEDAFADLPPARRCGRSRAPGLVTAGEFPLRAEDYGIPIVRAGATVSAAGSLAGSVVIDHCLSRLFVAAYLLTGCARSAEAGTMESVQQLDMPATPQGCLPWKAIARTMVHAVPDSARPPAAAPSRQLPAELLRVLRLPSPLRQCFVLRVLMAMPGHYCACLLHLDAAQVDANTHLAARELASMAAPAAPLAHETYS
jgi:hypothetical protein